MSKNSFIALIVVLAIVAGGGFFYQKSKSDEAMMMKKEKESSMMKEDGQKKDAMMDDKKVMDDKKMMGDTMTAQYSGKVLAGKSAPFIEFTQADYDKAQKEGKIIILDFYANWCPICRAEAPELAKGFDSLTSDKVVGFRVNYKDSDTDAAEKKLAESLEIPYQHYKVIIKNGKVILKTGDQWTSKEVVAAVQKALGQ